MRTEEHDGFRSKKLYGLDSVKGRDAGTFEISFTPRDDFLLQRFMLSTTMAAAFELQWVELAGKRHLFRPRFMFNQGSTSGSIWLALSIWIKAGTEARLSVLCKEHGKRFTACAVGEP